MVQQLKAMEKMPNLMFGIIEELNELLMDRKIANLKTCQEQKFIAKVSKMLTSQKENTARQAETSLVGQMMVFFVLILYNHIIVKM